MTTSPLLGRRRDGLRIVQPGTDEPLPVGPADPANLTIVGSAIGTPYDAAYGVDYADGLCYTTAFGTTPDTFTITNVSDPFNPVMVSQTGVTSAYSVVYNNGYCYVTGLPEDMLRVLDVSTPSGPTVVGSVTNATLLDGPDHVVYRDGFCYISCANADAVTVVDVTDPTTPVIRGHVKDTNILLDPIGVNHSGTYLYAVGFSNSALVTIDASDPDAPVILGSITDPIMGRPRAADVHDGICYVANQDGTFVIIDGTDPANPTILGSLTDAQLEGSFSVTLVQGNIAYVATQGNKTGNEGVRSVDVSDPVNPTILDAVGHIDSRRMVVSEGTIYVTDLSDDALRIVQ